MFDALSIFTADMGRTLAFYRRLGLDIPAGADSEPHVEHRLPGGFTLMWDTYDTLAAYDPAFPAVAGSPSPSGSSPELAFRCESPAEVDERHETLTAAGYTSHLAPFDAFWEQRFAVVLDPDGHHVAFYAAMTPPLPLSGAG